MQLTGFQKTVLDFITSEVLALTIHRQNCSDHKERIRRVASYAWALHDDLCNSGYLIAFNPTMLNNRGLLPTHVAFFNHLHPLQDFVNLVSNLAQ